MSADVHQTYIIDTSAAEASLRRVDEAAVKAMAGVDTSSKKAGYGLKAIADAAAAADKKLAAAFKAAEKSVKDFERSEAKAAAALVRDQERAARAAEKAAQAQDKLAKKFATPDVDRFGAALGRVGGALAKIGALATTVVGGLSFAKAIQDALEFEAISARIAARGGGLSANSVKGLVGGLGSASDLAAGLEEIQKLGHQGAEAMDLLALGAKAAKAEGADLGATLRVIDDSLDAYNLGADRAKDVTDLIAKGAKQAGEDFGTFGSALTKVLPLASQLGISFQDTTAAMDTMIEHGVKSDRAAAALSQFLGKFVGQGKALSAAGLDVSGTLQAGGIEALVKAVKNASGESAAALEHLGVSSRTLGPILTLLAEDAKSVGVNLAGLSGAAGTVEEDFARMSKTLSFQFDEFKNSVGLALIEIGQGFLEEFLPNVSEAGKSLKEMIASGDFKEWGRSIAEAVKGIGEALRPVSAQLDGFVKFLRDEGADQSISGTEAIAGGFVAMGAVISSTILGAKALVVDLATAATFAGRAVEIAMNPSKALERTPVQAQLEDLARMKAELEKQYASLNSPAVHYDTGSNKTPYKSLADAIAEADAKANAAIPTIRNLAGAVGNAPGGAGDAAGKAAKELASFEKSLGLLSKHDFDLRSKAFGNLLDSFDAQGIDSGPRFEAFHKALVKFGQEAEASGFGQLGGRLGDEFAKGLAESAGKIEPLKISLKGLHGETKENAAAFLELDSSLHTMSRGASEAFASLKQSLGILTNSQIADQGKAIAETMLLLEQHGKTSAQAIGLLAPEITKLVDSASLMGQKVPEDIANAFKTNAITEFGSAFGSIVGQVLSGSTSIGEGLRSVIPALGAFAAAMKKAQAAGATGGASLGAGAKAAGVASGILKLNEDGSVNGAGTFAAGANMAGNLIQGNKTYGARAVAGNALRGAGTGAMIGSVIPGVGTVVGAVVGAVIGGIVGLLHHKPTWEKIAEEVKTNLGFALSEGTAKALEGIKKSLKVSQYLSEVIGLDQIAKEATVTGQNVAALSTMALGQLELARKGGKGAAEAAAGLESAWSQIITKADEAGQTSSKAFVTMIVAGRQAGQEVAAAFDFTNKRIGEAIAGLDSFLVGLGKITDPARLKGISAIGAAIFDAFTAMPGGLMAASAAIGDSLDSIAKHYKDLGLAIPDALGHAIDLKNFAAANADLLNGIQGLAQAARGLGETGFFTADAFAAIGAEADASFARLTAAGLGEKDALEQIAPVLQQLVNEHLRNGKAIDSETQKLIDQAEGYGLISTKGTDAANALHSEFDRLIAALALGFGKTFPDAVLHGASQAANAIGGLTDQAKRDLASIPTGSGATVLGGKLPPRLPPGPKGSQVETHAAGGPGPGYTGQGEYVFSEPAVSNAGGMQIMQRLHDFLTSGGSAGGGRPMNLHVYLDGVKQGVRRMVQADLDNGELHISLSGAAVGR